MKQNISKVTIFVRAMILKYNNSGYSDLFSPSL